MRMPKNIRSSLSGNFRVSEARQFQADLEDDFRGQQIKIKSKLNIYVYPQLRQNPYFGKNIKKLKNYTPDTWRYRIGDFRFFYVIDERDQMIIMTAADNRGSAY